MGSHTAAAELFSFCHIELTLGLRVDLYLFTHVAEIPRIFSTNKIVAIQVSSLPV